MTHSKLTNQIRLSGQSSARGGQKVDRFIVHHAASTSLSGVVDMMVRATREVSANYVVGDRIVCVVDEDRRAWTSASSYWDGRAITVETINNSANGWTVSERTFDNLAKLIADVATRYRFPIDDTHIITHQELYTRYGASYPTACPGDLQRRKSELIARARKYAGANAATKAPTSKTPSQPRSWQADAFGIGATASRDQWRVIQSWLRKLGRYHGPVDGIPGQQTWRGIQITVRDRDSYTGPIDGIPGRNTARAMQRYARAGGYRGPIDGVLGHQSWAGFVRRLSS
ncbi:N-acetylmuramoyl-L-alanine amidase [Gulosibacter sp. GYB002]|uniref:N-acetylmuramoyl-L-alanine amidase n=1 Tax=Gulosibacter sp. GYB002 TaxID=2994391 RepID=UPI002F96ACA2